MNFDSSSDSLPQMSEINMTPLMDLRFILLITFIITFPLIEQGIPLDLPTANAAQLQKHCRNISINMSGSLYLDEKNVNSEQLTAAMNALGRAGPNTTVYVRADKAIDYGRVVEVLRIVHHAGITKMALVTQAEGTSK